MLCDPVDCSLPGSSVHGIRQARILEWVAMPISRALPNPGIKLESLTSSAKAGRFFTTSATWEAPTRYHLTAISQLALSNLLCKSREFERRKEFCPVEEGKRLSTLFLGSFLLYKLKFKIVILTAEADGVKGTCPRSQSRALAVVKPRHQISAFLFHADFQFKTNISHHFIFSAKAPYAGMKDSSMVS